MSPRGRVASHRVGLVWLHVRDVPAEVIVACPATASDRPCSSMRTGVSGSSVAAKRRPPGGWPAGLVANLVLKGDPALWAKVRASLSAALGIGLLLGLLGLAGCAGEGAGSLPESKAKRDEAQKARELGPGGALTPAAKPKRR